MEELPAREPSPVDGAEAWRAPRTDGAKLCPDSPCSTGRGEALPAVQLRPAAPSRAFSLSLCLQFPHTLAPGPEGLVDQTGRTF